MQMRTGGQYWADLFGCLRTLRTMAQSQPPVAVTETGPGLPGGSDGCRRVQAVVRKRQLSAGRGTG